jgi:hypothetical protein
VQAPLFDLCEVRHQLREQLAARPDAPMEAIDQLSIRKRCELPERALTSSNPRVPHTLAITRQISTASAPRQRVIVAFDAFGTESHA